MVLRRLMYSMAVLPQDSQASKSVTLFKLQKEKPGTRTMKPALGEDKVQKHLRNLKLCRLREPDEIFLRVLKELAK